MNNDSSHMKMTPAFPTPWETLDSGSDPMSDGHFAELASLFALALMRLRRERVIQNQRLSNVGKLPVSRSSREVSLDDVARSAKLATGDGVI
jgi:hypothetical protein